MQPLKNVSLKDKNWFRTGGPAKLFSTPTTANEFKNTLETEENIFVLGEGANILISDKGFDGLVIQPKLENIAINGEYVTSGAGVSMGNLIDHCLSHGLSGLEEFSGIPGTVGGSVFINIHYFEFLLSEFLHKATAISRDGQILVVDKKWFEFGYNTSKLHEKKHFLVDATFKLKKITDISYARGRRDEIIRHRSKRYPNKGTCGSFFRNFFPEEVPDIHGKKIIYVAYYLDKIGVKGNLRVNDAVVSHKHANMLVNTGNATTNDIITLAQTMQELVYREYEILPAPECRLIGFKEYPLHTLDTISKNLNANQNKITLGAL